MKDAEFSSVVKYIILHRVTKTQKKTYRRSSTYLMTIKQERFPSEI